MHKLALLISVVVLTGCSGHDPRVLDANPRSYTVCYFTARTPYELVAWEAQRHCDMQDGRSAVRISTRKCGVASEEVTYQCVK